MIAGIDFAALLQPVAEGSPSGEDLELSGDADFANYVFPAEGRLPAKFLDASGKVIFDRSQLDIDSEVTQIAGLLARSRDLRLAVMLVQFGAASLNLELFSSSLVFVRDLLEFQWETVHPQPENGDYTMRKTAVEAMDDRIRVAIPLAYIPLARSRSVGTLTYRSIELARKPSLKREAETVLPLAAVEEALAETDSQVELARNLAALQDAINALKSIRAMFLDRVDYAQSAEFPATQAMLEAMADAVLGALPQVQKAGDEPTIMQGSATSDHDLAINLSSPSQADKASPLPKGPVVSCHGEAVGILEDIEGYFADKEPSSPGLLLVHQARKLIGRPLIEAVEALAGAKAEQVQIKLGRASGFTLNIERLRQLSGSAIGSHIIEPIRKEGQKPIVSRQHAQAAMLSIENYLSDAEPSSPVPLLLAKARQLMSREFSDVLNEMISSGDNN